MTTGKSIDINTVIVDGDFDNFSAALSRSILGVTYVKFKRKKSEFFEHRVHNKAITKKMCDKIYECLLKHRELQLDQKLRDFKLRTSLTLNWNQKGKIIGVSNVKVCIYSEIGQLSLEKLQLIENAEKIKIDFFYTQVDDNSIKLEKTLPQILESMGGHETFDFNKHNFLTDEGRDAAKVFSIDRVPTVVIDGKAFVNPNENKLRQEILGVFSPNIEAIKPEFKFSQVAKSNVTRLATILKINE